MISSWDIELKEQVERDFKNYQIIELDLSKARTNEAYPIPGNCLQMIEYSSASATATVRFGKNTNEEITLKFLRKIKPSIFTSFYISNSAQAGESLVLAVGINFEIDNIIDQGQGTAQPTLTMTNALANTNTVGPNNPCNEVFLKADVKNIGIVFVDINKVAVQNSCIPLDPGDWIVRKIPNTNFINANFETASEKLFVSYSV